MDAADLYFFVAIEPLGGTMPEVKTIKVINPDGEGFMIINESDFDSKIHTRYEQRKQSKKDESQSKTKQRTEPASDLELARIQELESIYQQDGWRAIADLAEGMGIEKPEKGWRDAISLIAEKELAS